jgi:hypothetical protein
MTDKDRQRQRERVSLTPQGRAPNWMLVLVAGAFTAAALLASLFT